MEAGRKTAGTDKKTKKKKRSVNRPRKVDCLTLKMASFKPACFDLALFLFSQFHFLSSVSPPSHFLRIKILVLLS